MLSSGTITSSSPTAQPAEVLLQATPPHRRARSAAWSYIFLPEEAWCDLTIHLPAAVLLKEIHIQPHLASLASESGTSSGRLVPPFPQGGSTPFYLHRVSLSLSLVQRARHRSPWRSAPMA